MSNILKKYTTTSPILFLLFSTIQSSVFAASSPSCYTPIPSKPGCSGLTSISDVKHKGQLKCFTIDKKAKDCGVFVNVLPTDTDQGLAGSLESIDCTGEDRNTEDCVNYCFNNLTAPECTDCSTLTEIEKEEYPYCQDEESAKYCEAIIDYGNGSSWLKTRAGIVNATGYCLEGYTGAPIRNCLLSGIWDGITSGACVPISGCDNALLNTNNEVPYAIFTITTGTTEIGQEQEATTCETGYEMAGSVYAVCQSDGTWQYGNSNPLVDVADSCVIKICQINNISSSLLNSENTDTIIQCTNSDCSTTVGEPISLGTAQTVQYGQFFKVNSCNSGYGLVGLADEDEDVDVDVDRVIKCDVNESGSGQWVLASPVGSSKYCHINCSPNSPVISANDITLFEQAGQMLSNCVISNPNSCGISWGYIYPALTNFNMTSINSTSHNFDLALGSFTGINWIANYSYMQCKKDTHGIMYFKYDRDCCLLSNLITTSEGINVNWSIGLMTSTVQKGICSNHNYAQGTCNVYPAKTIAAKCESDGQWSYVGSCI